MKNFSIIAVFMLHSIFMLAQTKPNFVCSFFGTDVGSKIRNGEINSFTSNSQAVQIVDKILLPTGLQRNFIIQESPEVANACAVNLMDKRYILYNNGFMQMVDNSTKTDWAAISILAHEIGHHLNGHTLDNKGSRPDKELEADDFSGFVLYKLGATLQDAQKAISTLVSEEGNATHPGKFPRLAAIQKGWSRAAAQSSSTPTNPNRTASTAPSTSSRLEDNMEFKSKVKSAVNNMFHKWDDRWSVDKYIDDSNSISSITKDGDNYKFSGNFKVNRSLLFTNQVVSVQYIAKVSATSSSSFEVISLCYIDGSAGMQDCY